MLAAMRALQRRPRLLGFTALVLLLAAPSSGGLRTQHAARAPHVMHLATTHSVVSFGAVGDGRTSCTAAFRRACAAAAADRGTVLVPPGRFLTGAFNITSGVTLDVRAGVVRATHIRNPIVTLQYSTHAAYYSSPTLYHQFSDHIQLLAF